MNDVQQENRGGVVDVLAAERLVQGVLRRLLRVSTPEQAVSELVGLVHQFGGWTVPAALQDDCVLPVDLSMGVLPDPLLPAAEPYSNARLHLETHLPGLVEDVRAIVSRLDQTGRALTEAAVDPLTGLANRRGLARVLTHGQYGDAIVMLDLDHFKVLNDTHGHQAGDDVLTAFAQVLRACVREADAACRMGGEEFLLYLPSTSTEMACRVVERIRQRWSSARPLPVTFSAGVAAVADGTVHAAVQAADDALYRAKHAGRDRVEISGITS